MNSKCRLGQFYTTHYTYILQNMVIPNSVSKIIEPFVGQGHLLKWLESRDQYQLELFDIDPKIDQAIKQDTLMNPPDYTNKFVLTNPPYLARNKNPDKTLYDKYQCNDLYKCFIIQIIDCGCLGGIIIVPVNFLCSIRKSDTQLRRRFLDKFKIQLINVFEESVFDDTNYSVCSILFIAKTPNLSYSCESIPIHIYPIQKKLHVMLDSHNQYTIGGEIYHLPINPDILVTRATQENENCPHLTHIVLKCIDDHDTNRLGFRMDSYRDRYIDRSQNRSARSYATLLINQPLNLDKQKKLVDQMNLFIEKHREQYHSLFLTNYRESNSIARKRISFDLAYRICNFTLSNMV